MIEITNWREEENPAIIYVGILPFMGEKNSTLSRETQQL